MSMEVAQAHWITKGAPAQINGLLEDVRRSVRMRIRKSGVEWEWSRHVAVRDGVHHMKGAVNRFPKNQVAGGHSEHRVSVCDPEGHRCTQMHRSCETAL